VPYVIAHVSIQDRSQTVQKTCPLVEPSNQQEKRGICNTKPTPKTDSWSNQQLAGPIRAMRTGATIKIAARHHQLPASFLQDHFYGTTIGRKRGR
jgi:hypothetical protein